MEVSAAMLDIISSYHILTEFNVSTKDIELFWISLAIPNCKKIIIGNVYRPPQGNVKLFCDTLDDKLLALKNRQRQNFETFILRDFYINYNLTNNPDTKQLKWFEQKSSLKQIITTITGFSDTNSCIDLIYTDSPSVFDYGTLDVNLSDHEMILLLGDTLGKIRPQKLFLVDLT